MLVVFFRALILYILIMVCLRLMGKRQLGELQPSELVITILISNIASLPIEDTGIPMILGAIPVLALVSFEIIISNLSLKSKWFRGFISGSPIVIISNGVLDQNQLRKLRFSIDDLMEALRQSNIFDLRDVQFAIVETTGKVSVLQKYESQPVTNKDLKLKSQDPAPATVVISDGEIVKAVLPFINITEDWVKSIAAANATSVKDIFIMTVNNRNDYYIIPKQKRI
ncbi:DUF421 domain-containing protein [Paludicola sp. MB14-C6]|uniref:DUF421 domain-containing protein n=1 Tax=Paludihabitans sp. MB14-C6 TaxID=3070656 RepID=UPI0027DDDE65|nr:DUF421 domain-containing protein [Paludicola sp. MB14-C6]WMJ23497.1 DUF421 domain-containing protein [Paludicola sp. MB14-C6]